MSAWISVKDRFPRIGDKVLVAFDNGDVACLNWNCSFAAYREVRYWMPFPEPTPKPDAFEEFWGDCGKADGQENYRYVGWAQKSPIVAPVFKQTAKCIWDAAIASTKQSVV